MHVTASDCHRKRFSVCLRPNLAVLFTWHHRPRALSSLEASAHSRPPPTSLCSPRPLTPGTTSSSSQQHPPHPSPTYHTSQHTTHNRPKILTKKHRRQGTYCSPAPQKYPTANQCPAAALRIRFYQVISCRVDKPNKSKTSPFDNAIRQRQEGR